MNLAKLALFSCPIALASLVLVDNPAAASVTDSLLLPGLVEVATTDRPLFPTGCACARCTGAEDLLQGEFPAF